MPDGLQLVSSDPYRRMYDSLSEIRELFHSEGRLPDSNSKLDEITKLIAIRIGQAAGVIADEALGNRSHPPDLTRLGDLFTQVALSPLFLRGDGGSIFGPKPSLALHAGDEKIAGYLIELAALAVEAHPEAGGISNLDPLNEAFGHFVRDNFRNNTEDAQYMTPPEVVSLMVELAISDLLTLPKQKEYVVVDPSCGVGSFLLSFFRAYEALGKTKDLPPLRILAQDKVDRMAALSFMNLSMFRAKEHGIYVGNSLWDESPLSEVDGKVDLILTNPPFGAKFTRADLSETSRRVLPTFAHSRSPYAMVDSEILFLDRYLTLLRPGGRCLVVVPDGVVSAAGVAAYARQELADKVRLKAIIELPAETFAQAGTRTKTAVLYFQKGKRGLKEVDRVFLAEVRSLGFQVSKRKGATVKRTEGRNQIPDILDAYRAGRSEG
jgi:type I restriction-modification system DNA methylase subunit